MSGGILLPGNASAAQVLSGQTFTSSVAGFNTSGSLAVPQGTLIGSPSLGPDGSTSESSFNITVPVKNANDILVLLIAGCATKAAASTVSGAAGTWTKAQSEQGATYSSAEIWIGTGLTVGSETCSVTLTGAAYVASIVVELFGLTGTVHANTGVTSDSTYNAGASLACASGGVLIGALGVEGYGLAGGHGDLPHGLPTPPIHLSIGDNAANVAQPLGLICPNTSSATYSPTWILNDTAADLEWSVALANII